MPYRTPRSSAWKQRKGAGRGDNSFFWGHVLEIALIPLAIMWPQGHSYSTPKEAGNYSLCSGCLNAEIKCFYCGRREEEERDIWGQCQLCSLFCLCLHHLRKVPRPCSITAKPIALVFWVLEHPFCKVKPFCKHLHTPVMEQWKIQGSTI